MPLPNRSLYWLLATGLALSACRPGDTPKEPTEPSEPTVSRAPDTRSGDGVSVATARRSIAVAKL